MGVGTTLRGGEHTVSSISVRGDKPHTFQWGYLGLMHHHVRAGPPSGSESKNPQAQIEGVIVDDRPSSRVGRAKTVSY